MIRNVIENTLKTRIILMVLFMIGGNLLTAQQDSLFPRNLYQQMIGEHPQDPAKPEFYIRSRNNDYQLGLGGFVKLNGLYDFVGLANTNSFMTEEIPVGEENIKDNHLHFDIYQTRLYSEILGNTPYGEMKIYFECDFTNPIGLVKIRHAYGFIKGFLIGKTTSTLVDLEAIPYTVDAEGPNSMILARRVMVRYSFNAGKYITLFMAAEASQPQVTYSEYTEEVYQYLPDAVLRIRLKMKEDIYPLVVSSGISLMGIHYISKRGTRAAGATRCQDRTGCFLKSGFFSRRPMVLGLPVISMTLC
jgi:hypothetical protein